MRKANACRSTVWGLCVLVMLVGLGCSSADEQAFKEGLNPAPPIRKAFLVSLEVYAQQIDQYVMMRGEAPQGDGVEVVQQAGIRGVPTKDPWDGEVRYHGEGAHYTLSSAGPDTQWETKDDIVIQR
jgi:hypothetical protein